MEILRATDLACWRIFYYREKRPCGSDDVANVFVSKKIKAISFNAF